MTTREEALALFNRLFVAYDEYEYSGKPGREMKFRNIQNRVIDFLNENRETIRAALSPPPDEVIEALEKLSRWADYGTTSCQEAEKDSTVKLLRNHIQGRGE